MHNYAMLSDHDFELLAASLLEAEFGGHWEVFARGGDGGVDVRRNDLAGRHVVQCKHMLGSPVSTLRTAARKEKKNVDALRPAPATYRFWTTKPLSQDNKRDLMADLKPWIKREEDIWGQDEIENALKKHPEVERGHVKLWIAGAGQLSAQVNAGIWERSRQLAVDIDEAIPRYVETGVFDGALKVLEKNRVLIISGPPGVGKTTVARLLVAEAALEGYEPVEISSDVSEGQQVVDFSRKQTFYYDDFLGSTFLSNRLDKNEDKRLASFIRACEQSNSAKFVMTTREYILRQALEDYEELERAGVHIKKLVIQLRDYTRVERGRILYNHLYHSPYVGADELAQLRKNKSYLKVIDHKNYNPRLIEFVTMTDPRLRDGAPENFVDYALATLDSPETVWRKPFDSQLNAKSQSLVMLLACLPSPLKDTEVQELLRSAADNGLCDAILPGDLEKTLKVLDDSFLATQRGGPSGTDLVIGIQNPSIGDFVAGLLCSEASRRQAVMASVLFFEQVSWLFENLYERLSGGDREELEDQIAEALIRCYGRPMPRLTRPEPLTFEAPKWSHSDPVERLLTISRIMSRSARCAQRLSASFKERLSTQAELWRTNPAAFAEETCADIVRLLASLQQAYLPDEVWNAAVGLIEGLDASSAKWDMLNRLGEIRGFDVDFLSPWRAEFDAWFDQLLDASVDDVSLGDLDDARSLAESLGTEVDTGRFEELYGELAMRQDELDNRAYEEWKDTRGYNEGDTELGAIFER